MQKHLWTLALSSFLAVCLTLSAQSAALIELSAEQEAQCLSILRDGLATEEFWPSMHAAEALTLAGYGDEVREVVEPMLATVTDLQHRCGLARELVRAGDRSKAKILLDLIADPDSYAHIHAAESSYKVWVLGDGVAMREAFADRANASRSMMAAGALARWGNVEALAYLRKRVESADVDVARIAAWVLGRVGDASDFVALRAGQERFDDPLAKSFFTHALAALGDPKGIEGLLQNFGSEEPSARTMAATFAGEMGLTKAKEQLLGLLNDEHFDARVRSAQALLQMARDTPAPPEGVVVSEVYPATEANPRYSEGDIHVLNDGRMLYGTTEFIEDWSDFAKARIVGRISADGGQTWGERMVLQENIGGKNVMSLTFQALSDSAVGMFYLRKNDFDDLDVYLRPSTDGGLTWDEAILVTDAPGYHVMNNDRVIRLKSGRILVPVSSSPNVKTDNHFKCSVWYSDDAGDTWRVSRDVVDYAKRGAMEPELLELNNGRILMIIRTQLGHIGAAYSEDGGDTWSEAADWGVRAPEAPSTLRRIPSTGDLLLIWNDTFVDGAGHGGKRAPLTVAISKDEGKTWIHKKNIESIAGDPSVFMGGFSYISATFDRGRVLLGYYVGEADAKKISSRFRSFPISWLYE
ncbi:MAG: exo-alpha-sialidase [Candidatus Hydrogenedentes bacterium]|nr:exo-alpha-sialidase [Candidatus Hydrogenedentota bacterium]